MRFELAGEGVHRPGRGSATSKLIDGRIAQYPVEPRHDSFVGGCLIGIGHDTREGILEDVFGQRAVADAALEICEEGSVVLDQRRQLPGDLLFTNLLRCHSDQYRCRTDS